jgi:hypothetical protein
MEPKYYVSGRDCEAHNLRCLILSLTYGLLRRYPRCGFSHLYPNLDNSRLARTEQGVRDLGARTPMAQPEHRRSERVLVDVAVAIRGESEDHKPFQEETFTVTVSAHGALVMLGTKVALGQKVTLLNPTTYDEREGRVSFMGRQHAGLAQVAIEFLKPAPEFWPISSPPTGWKRS